MEIKNDSWHCWLYEAGHGGHAPEKTNLCRYFWRVVAGASFVAGICAIYTAAIVGVGVMFYLHTFFMFAVLGGIAALLGGIYLYWRFEERAWKRTRVPGYQEPEPGLLRSYLRAKKEKVCPLVKIVDAE